MFNSTNFTANVFLPSRDVRASIAWSLGSNITYLTADGFWNELPEERVTSAHPRQKERHHLPWCLVSAPTQERKNVIIFLGVLCQRPPKKERTSSSSLVSCVSAHPRKKERHHLPWCLVSAPTQDRNNVIIFLGVLCQRPPKGEDGQLLSRGRKLPLFV